MDGCSDKLLLRFQSACFPIEAISLHIKKFHFWPIFSTQTAQTHICHKYPTNGTNIYCRNCVRLGSISSDHKCVNGSNPLSIYVQNYQHVFYELHEAFEPSKTPVLD